jgi:hypothetical protein
MPSAVRQGRDFVRFVLVVVGWITQSILIEFCDLSKKK